MRCLQDNPLLILNLRKKFMLILLILGSCVFQIQDCSQQFELGYLSLSLIDFSNVSSSNVLMAGIQHISYEIFQVSSYKESRGSVLRIKRSNVLFYQAISCIECHYNPDFELNKGYPIICEWLSVNSKYFHILMNDCLLLMMGISIPGNTVPLLKWLVGDK